MKTRNYLLDLLKIFAILLVFNSHCDKLYPNSIFATGGAIGNILFFIISGYLLNINNNFKNFIIKKFLRIYIPVTLINFTTILIKLNKIENIKELILFFIWPTNYWFIGAIILYYPFIYLLNKLIKNYKQYTYFSLIILIIYFIYYFLGINKSSWSIETTGITSLQGCFKLIPCFYAFTLGYFIKKLDKIYTKNIYKLKKCFAIFIIYFLFKFFISKNIFFMNFQFLCHFFEILFAYFSLNYVINQENLFFLVENSYFKKTIMKLSQISLEIYLIQFYIIKYMENIIFPLNLIFALSITIVISLIYNYISNYLYKKLFNK